MRIHHIVAVVAVFILAFGALQFFSSPFKAEAETFSAESMNVLQMHRDTNMQALPVQTVHDMTLVFDGN